MSTHPSNDDSFLLTDSASVPTETAAPILLGKFRLISILGKGSMGKVLRAEDTKLKRQVALKCLRKDKGAVTYRTEQFIREARSAANLEHPSIVHIYEVGEANNYHYIAMELIEGGSLGALVKACGPLDLLRASQLAAEAAEGLAYAAQMGVVHRDIKPENLMLTRSGRCKITDFGLARLDDPSDGFAMPQGTVGTPHYMAPETIRGFAATGKSDVYSLGCVLFFLLTGKAPFHSKDRGELLRMHAEMPPPDVRVQRPDLPESLAKILARSLAKNPDDRPTSDTFAKQLRAHTIPVSGSGSQILSGPASPFVPSMPEAKPRRRMEWLAFTSIGVAAALLIVCIVMFVMATNKPQGATAQPAVAPAPAVSPTPVAVAPAPVPVQDVSALATASANSVPKPDAAADIPVVDQAAILAAAKANQKVTLRGIPSAVHLDPAAKIAAITFRDNPDFKVLYASRLYNAIGKKFGGKDGTGMINKPILITGYPTFTDGHVELLLTASSQIDPAN